MKTRMRLLGRMLHFLVLTDLVVMTILAVLPAQKAHALAQRVGTYELGVDAPWRMEPRPDRSGNLRSGPIPISLSIHDANSHEYVQGSDGLGYQASLIPSRELLRFESIRIVELDSNGSTVQTANYTLDNIYEVEVTKGNWFCDAPQCVESEPLAFIEPEHHICRRWNGESCSSTTYELRGSSEWHAVLFYRPRGLTGPGRDTHIRAELMIREQGLYENGSGELEFRGEHTKKYVQHLSVHHGEGPLPKFDGDWAYGDLHYHSQGTDNDGETAMSYRSLVQTMGAIGLDFTFATEHASNSKQLVFGEFVLIPDFPFNGIPAPYLDEQFYGLRDMSFTRFKFNHGMLNNIGGVNGDMKPLTTQAGKLSVPQVFLAGEVDSIPEVPAGQDLVGTGTFNIHNSCMDLPNWVKFLMTGNFDYINPFNGSGQPHACDLDDLIETRGDRWLIKDVQGLGKTDYFARQHLLHLPANGDRDDAFIPSNTSRYGGATRRLAELFDEIEIKDTGYVFLAHPFSASNGDGSGRLGPDLVPFSEVQLRDAFASERVLGLQIWNSDTNLWTEMGDGEARDDYGDVYNQKAEFVAVADLDAWEHGDRKPYGHSVGDRSVALWDVVQLWGLDPNKTNDIDWLTAGQPRRMLMAGGSDGHGDYNFRREGYATGTSEVTDTAIGKPRNLVNAGEPIGEPRSSDRGGLGRPYTQTQIVNALRSGEFSVTDGPALRIVFDVNNNGVIDEEDMPMGGIVNRKSLCELPILVEWKSTPEFGPVKQIVLYLGIHSDMHNKGMLYRGWQHNLAPEASQSVDLYLDESTGRRYPFFNGTNYKALGMELGWIDPTRINTDDGDLVIFVNDAEKYGGVHQIIIDPEDFPVGLPRIVEVKRKTMAFFPTQNTTSSVQPISVTALKASINDSKPGGIDIDGILNPHDPVERLYFFEDAVPADRMYIRAMTIGEAPGGREVECTVARDECVKRKAFSNPIWINLNKSVVVDQNVSCKNDSDGNGLYNPDNDASNDSPILGSHAPSSDKTVNKAFGSSEPSRITKPLGVPRAGEPSTTRGMQPIWGR